MDKKESQALLLAHYKSPTGLGNITENHLIGKGTNPLCGDEISVGVTIENNIITDIKFQARACSICIASSSIMSELLINKAPAQIEHYYQELTDLLKQPSLSSQKEPSASKKEPSASQIEERLKPLASISKMPSRHKCAQLAWEAIHEACQLPH